MCTFTFAWFKSSLQKVIIKSVIISAYRYPQENVLASFAGSGLVLPCCSLNQWHAGWSLLEILRLLRTLPKGFVEESMQADRQK